MNSSAVCIVVCNCVAANTVNKNVNDCDNVSGQCQCKQKPTAFIHGLRCELCRDDHYLHPDYGCVRCDHCPSDRLIGDGSCQYSKSLRYHHQLHSLRQFL